MIELCLLNQFDKLLLCPVRGAEYHQPACLSVSVCPRAYLWTDLHEMFCVDPLWPWFGPSLVALRYMMYFQFYGCHVWP